MSIKRDDVVFPLFAHTHADACAEAWKAGKAFFAHEGRVWLVLGPGTSELDWFDAGVQIKELAR